MELEKLFEMQRELDNRITEQRPELQGKDNLEWKTLALIVEIGECANEWRGFKKWSDNQEPNIHAHKPHYIDVPCDPNVPDGPVYRKDIGRTWNPMLEEYVDCLHFILSIGIELNFTDLHINQSTVGALQMKGDVLEKFNRVFAYVYKVKRHKKKFWYDALLESFIGLGFSLGFTWKQIEEAYYSKNKINHERQESGY